MCDGGYGESPSGEGGVQADAMTADELEAFRKEVREELRKASEIMGRPVVHDFGVAAAVAAGALRDVPLLLSLQQPLPIRVSDPAGP
jgi:hypothetical protein